MKLDELMKLCESDNTKTSFAAQNLLRHHAANVLPELVEWVKKNSKHHSHCSLANGFQNNARCTCGLEAILARATELKTE
jgi:hypothetical protein